MTSPDISDINTPTRDRSLEPLRQAVVRAIADVSKRADDFYAAVGVINQQLAAMAAQVNALNIRADASEIRAQTAYAAIDDLQARVAALQNPLPPEA